MKIIASAMVKPKCTSKYLRLPFVSGIGLGVEPHPSHFQAQLSRAHSSKEVKPELQSPEGIRRHGTCLRSHHTELGRSPQQP